MAEVRMNLLLMGKTGVGKSATGNTILGRKCFEEYDTTISGTKEVQYDTGKFENIDVYVVDPPGLMDTEITSEEQEKQAGTNMLLALMWCCGEIDAFVLVISYLSRFTEEDKNTLEILKIIFGENYFKHVILVLTHGDSFTADMEHEDTLEKSIDTWCKEQTGAFRQLFKDCEGRVVSFNNREKDEVKMHEQRRKLIQLVKDVQRQNGRYTSETLEDAKEVYAELRQAVGELMLAHLSERERIETLTGAAYTTFFLAATVVGAPIAVLCGVATGVYAIVSKIQSNMRFKRTCTKIAGVTGKLMRLRQKYAT